MSSSAPSCRRSAGTRGAREAIGVRYVLIDRITALEPGRTLAAIKNVSLGDDLVVRVRPGVSALPASMVLEAMAQAAGLLVVASVQEPAQPVLAKVQPFTAYGE